MVGLVDDLERLGLAERRRSDADRRVQDIHLTDRGRATVDRIFELADEENERTFGVLDDEQRAQLHGLLLQVAEATARLR
jgi:DNA-binding MarR family transcriptional regulator